VGPQAWTGAWLDAAFGSAVRAWLRTDAPIDGYSMVQGLREHAGLIPWLHLLASVGIVGSHDHPRLMSVVGSAERMKVALFLLLTFPSIPMLFAGDEYGLRGETAEQGRAPMPWPDTKRQPAIDLGPFVARLANLRRESAALSSGCFRWLAADDDAVAYMRRHNDERIVCVAARDSTELALTMPGASWESATDECPRVEVGDGVVRFVMSGDRLTGAWRLT
jgi:alpha-glucosidase